MKFRSEHLFLDNNNCIVFRNSSLCRKLFLKRIVFCSLWKHFLHWYIFICRKNSCWKVFAQKKVFEEYFGVYDVWKHFLQWYTFADKKVEKFVQRKKFLNRKLFAVCGNIFYSGIYLQIKFKLKSLCAEKIFE